MGMALRFRHRNGKIFLHNISRSSVRKFAEVQDDFAKEVRPIFDVMYCYVCFFSSPTLAEQGCMSADFCVVNIHVYGVSFFANKELIG